MICKERTEISNVTPVPSKPRLSFLNCKCGGLGSFLVCCTYVMVVSIVICVFVGFMERGKFKSAAFSFSIYCPLTMNHGLPVFCKVQQKLQKDEQELEGSDKDKHGARGEPTQPETLSSRNLILCFDHLHPSKVHPSRSTTQHNLG